MSRYATIHKKLSIFINSKGYRVYRSKKTGKLTLEHRALWEIFFGKIPKGCEIHHIDGDKLNNSINNLMLCTPKEHRRKHKILKGSE